MSLNPDTFVHVKIGGHIVHAFPDRETESVWVRLKNGRLREFPAETYTIIPERKPNGTD